MKQTFMLQPSMERKTRPLPSSSAIELSEQVKEGVPGIQGRVMAQMVKDFDILQKMVEEDRQTTQTIYHAIYGKLEDIEDQMPSQFIKRLWFPVTLAVVIAVILAWLGIK